MPLLLSRRAVLTGVTAAAGAAVLGGCGGADPAVGSGPPRRGGRVRAAFQGGGSSETLDPHLQRLWVEMARHKALFDKLTEVGDDMSPVPQLAASWEANRDGTRWRFRLREATFHDGRPVTAGDVLASYARILDPGAGGRRGAQLLRELDLANSRAVDPRTVELVLRAPVFELPARLSGTGMAIVPAGSEDFSRPVGSGPFRFVSYDAGRSMVARRFDDYWDGAAHIDELHVLSVEAQARGNALLGGQAEYADGLEPTFARLHGHGGDVRVWTAPESGMQAFAAKVDRPPFDDPAVFQALALAVDRKRLVDVVLAGMGEVGNDLFGKGYRYYADEIPQREHDPDRARWLLRKAGVADLRLRLDTADAGSGFVEAAALVAEQVAAAGITLTVANRNKDTFFADTLETGQLSNDLAGAMPIPNRMAIRMLSTSPQNSTRYRSAEFDDLYRRAQATEDVGRRTALYHDMQRLYHDAGGLLVWGCSDWISATAPGLSGVVAAKPNSLNWARFDKAWLG